MVNGDRESDFLYKLTFEGNALPLENVIQTIWPNPCIPRLDHPQVSFMLAQPGTVNINIFNLLGQLVYSERQMRSEGVKVVDLQVPVSSPAGLYFVQIETAETVMTRKFTVLK
jgi:hypothetical protein